MDSESFGHEEGGIRKFARVEASELKEGQRTVLRKFLTDEDGMRRGQKADS